MQTHLSLSTQFADAHPAEAAHVLQALPADETAALLALMPAAVAAPVLERLSSATAADCLTLLPLEHAASCLAPLPDTIAIGLLRWLDADRQTALLAAMPPADARALRLLLAFDEGTAGALMDPRVLCMHPDVTVGDALDRLRHLGHQVRYYVYVVDLQRRLVGVVTLSELMQAADGRSVGELMTRPVISVTTSDPVHTILAHPAWADVHALPVVDEERRLVGVLRAQTVRSLERSRFDRSHVEGSVAALTTFGELWWSAAAVMLHELALGLGGPTPRAKADASVDGRTT